jgi:hypothetical protein
MFRWLGNRLWPTCRAVGDVDLARVAFAVHAFHDPAWLRLGEDEIKRIIDGLE